MTPQQRETLCGVLEGLIQSLDGDESREVQAVQKKLRVILASIDRQTMSFTIPRFVTRAVRLTRALRNGGTNLTKGDFYFMVRIILWTLAFVLIHRLAFAHHVESLQAIESVSQAWPAIALACASLLAALKNWLLR